VLGNILDLCCHLFLRASVDAQFTPPIRLSEYEDVSSAITFILHRTTTKFEDHFQDILDLLRDAPAPDLELFLRRLLDHAERYTSTHSKYHADANSGLDNDLPRLKSMHIVVLCRLYQIYKNMGHHSEANQYKRQLADLSDLSPSQEASTFIELSESMFETFRTLDFPHKYSKHLPSPKTNLFPATHCAILSQRRFAAHFLQEWPRSNSRGYDILGRQALHLAAETSDFKLLDIVLRQEPSLLQSRDIYNMTPICVAAHVGNYDFFQRLVESGAQTLVTDISGRCLLCIAAGAGHTKIVNFLLEEGVEGGNRHLDHDYGSNTQQLVCLALHSAAAAGHFPVVDILLSHGGWPLYDLRGKLASQEALDHGFSVLSKHLQVAEARRREELMNPKLDAKDFQMELPDRYNEHFIFRDSITDICQPRLPEYTFSAVKRSRMNDFGIPSPALSEYSASSGCGKSKKMRANTCITSLSSNTDGLSGYDGIDRGRWYDCHSPVPDCSSDHLSYTFTPVIELPGGSEANSIQVN
jgi:ankyrin repeat protein